MSKPGRTTLRVALPGGGYMMRKSPVAQRGGPDLVGYVNGRRVEADVAAPTPKTCIGCGAKQQPDGSLPCGH